MDNISHVGGDFEREPIHSEGAKSKAEIKPSKIKRAPGKPKKTGRTSLAQRLAQREAELGILNSVQQGLASRLGFQGIIDLVGEKVGEIFSADTVDLWMYDAARDWNYYVYYSDRGQRLDFPPSPAPRPSLGTIILDGRKPLLLGTREEQIAHGAIRVPREEGKEDQNQSYLGVPILAEQKVLGLISVQSYQEKAFNESHLKLLTTLSNSMSVALENARLFDETQRLLKETEQRNAELAVINSVQQGLASKLEMQAIYELVGEKVSDITGSQIVVINTWNAEAGTVRYEYICEDGVRSPVIERPFSPLHQMILPELERGKSVVWNEGMSERLKKFRHSLPAGEMPLTVVSVPLKTGNRINTSISLQNTKREYAFSESTIRLVETLAGSTGIALENARLFDETQRLLRETEQHNAELAIINRVQQGLVSKLDFQGIIDLVGDKICDIFDAQSINIARYDADLDLFTSLYLVERGVRHSIDPMKPGPIFRRLLDTRESLFFETEEEFNAIRAITVPGTESSKSGIYVPLNQRNELFGVIALENVDREYAFSEADLRLLATLSNSMSVALENARLFDETQRLLKETEERNAELAVINSVQQALAAQLDMQGIDDAVGDKIRDIFDAQGVIIGTLDRENRQVIFNYFYEKGDRYYPEAVPFTGLIDHVIQTGEKVVINEKLVERGKEFGMVIIAGNASKSGMWLPIKSGKRVQGVIALQNMDHENAFPDSDVRLLETLANSMSIALENARLFDETQRLLKETEQRAQELAIINSVQRGLASKLDMQAIYDLVGERIRDIFQTEVVYIAIRDPNDLNRIDFPYYVDRGNILKALPLSLGEGLTSKVIMDRQPLLVGTFEEQIRLGAILEADERANTYLGIPIISGDFVAGVVSVQSYEENAFRDPDIRLLTTLASSMGVALENARLFNETQRLLKETEQRAGELAAISTVSQALVAETELDSMIQLIGSQMREIFEADIVYVALLDSQTDLIYFPYQYGEDFGTLKLGEGLASKIIQSGQPLLINKGIEERRKELGTSLVGKESLSYQGVPIYSGKETIGVLSVQSTTEEDAFDEDDQRLLMTIAANAGAAIHTAKLHAETQRRAREMTTLAEIGSDIAASRNLEPVLERIAAHAKDILHVRDIAIVLAEPESQLFKTVVALGKYVKQVKEYEIQLGKGLIGHILQTGEGKYINDPGHDPRVIHLPDTPEQEDASESLMGAPLISRGETIGGIMVWRDNRDGLFAQPDLDFLTSVARQTAIAIESARLYLETQRRAREMSALVDVGRDISASLEAEIVLESIATHAKDLLKGDLSALFLPESDGTKFRAIAAVGAEAENLRNDTVHFGTGILGNIARNKVGEIINDVNNDPRVIRITGTEIGEDEHLLAVPLLANEDLKGIMAVWRTGKGKEYMEAELEFLSGLSRQAVIAVQNAQLFAETTETLEQQTATSEILQVIASSPTNIQPVLDVIAQNAAQLSGSNDALIDIEDHGILRVAAHHGNIPMFPVGEGIPLNRELVAGRAIMEGSTLQAIHRHSGKTVEFPEGDKWAQKYGYRMTCSVPLMREGRAIGAITIRRLEPNLLQKKQIALIETFASQAVIAIENVRLFNETQHLLKETEQRAAELAIINSIQEGLASKLELQAVYDLVGDKI